jgi:hypothetical protein
MGLAMRKPLALTDDQMAIVRAASASLRLAARDRFLQDLACELARYPHPPTDTDLRVCIRQLLGLVPLCHLAHKDIA